MLNFKRGLGCRERQPYLPNTNESETLSILIFVLDRFKDSVRVLASQAIALIGVPSFRSGGRDGEDEVLVCPQELLPQPLLAQDFVKVDFKQSATIVQA